jgi:hypothetical protein
MPYFFQTLFGKSRDSVANDLINQANPGTSQPSYGVFDSFIGKTKINQIRGINQNNATGSGIPKQVTNVNVSVNNGQKGASCAVTVMFRRDPADSSFSGVTVYVKGYKGNSNPTQVASGPTSPITFTLDNTGENVSFLVQSFGNGGNAPISSAPSCGTTLPKSTTGGYGVNTTVSYNASNPPPSSTPIGYGYFLGCKDVAPPPSATGWIGFAYTANMIYGCELHLDVQYTITKAAALCVSGTGVAGDAFTTAIYNSTGTTKLLDAGTNAFSLKDSQKYTEATLGSPVTLSPGVYLFAFAANTASVGSVLIHQPYVWFEEMLNGITLGTPTRTRFFSAANALSSGNMPSSLGALTAYVSTTTPITPPAVIFETT